eukprot:TRINITY_DN5360_c0_g2_i1.p1 TRINITY_DN5360_c0_g2~~TRINITY_DN5360_c0_g2_i1.p1  ORF type:complete len:193 (-),score=14.61 TRINITY_DN5360_c0_g2_i1:185-763(-)
MGRKTKPIVHQKLPLASQSKSKACGQLLKHKAPLRKTKQQKLMLVGSKRARLAVQALEEAAQKNQSDGSFQYSQTSGTVSSQETSIPTVSSEGSRMFNTDLEESMQYLEFLQTLECESVHMVRKDYFQSVQEGRITQDSRSLIVSWLTHIAEDEQLQSETLHLSVRYLDRYLCNVQVEKSSLGLVALVCLFF